MANPDADWAFTLRDDWSDSDEAENAWFDEDDDEMYAGEEADEDDYEDSPEEQQAAQAINEDRFSQNDQTAATSAATSAATGHKQPKHAYGRTRRFLAALEELSHSVIQDRMCRIIDYMATLGFDIATFLHYFAFRLPDVATDQRVTYARASLIHGGLLIGIVDNLYCPPRRHGARRPKGAREVLYPWHVDKTKKSINKEMRALRPVFESPLSELSEEMLLAVKLQDLVRKVKRRSPTFWDILFDSSTTTRQRTRNTYKDPEPSVLMAISMMSFGRSQRRNLLQKLLSVFLKAGGLAARSNDTTHALGITMSQKWIYSGTNMIAETQRKARDKDMTTYPWFGGHDNLNIGFKVYQQRVDSKNHFDSGTAATIYVIKDPAVVAPDPIAAQACWREGVNKPISAVDIHDLEVAARPRLRAQGVHRILQFLLDSPAFDRSTYEHRDDILLSPPPPVKQLETSVELRLKQYMLDTAHLEESSIDGNEKCLKEWFRQIHLDSDEAKKELAYKKLIVWIGDQLTVSRLRSLKNIHSWELNWWDRMEELIEHFGWLHAEMAAEHSIHHQYWLTSEGLGLKHAFDLLERKGLSAPSTQGNFHQKIQEALAHVAEAHFRDLWYVVACVEDLAKLREKSPQELVALANKIYDEYASTEAVLKYTNIETTEPDKRDDVLLNSIRFCRDILDYLDLDDAIRSGDVGRMIDLLPRILFRYHGGNNSNYVIEILQLLQGLYREWPEDLREFIVKYCWLANTTGRENSFLAFDMVQEHNIRDIKYIFMVLGPFATWEYIKKISGAIPVLRSVKDHVEAEFNHFRRGKSHTDPGTEADIEFLRKSYRSGKAHRYQPGRKLSDAAKAKDYIHDGSQTAKLQATIDRWDGNRLKVRATTEEWDDEPPSTVDQMEVDHEQEHQESHHECVFCTQEDGLLSATSRIGTHSEV